MMWAQFCGSFHSLVLYSYFLHVDNASRTPLHKMCSPVHLSHNLIKINPRLQFHMRVSYHQLIFTRLAHMFSYP
ncbi:hypothetical protein F5884DRAFT_58864 [Xylogone sp. PMI_703]|nr:hypothetical protein F5884DRAFT_58864 [Xylogone sp. PMI_703]